MQRSACLLLALVAAAAAAPPQLAASPSLAQLRVEAQSELLVNSDAARPKAVPEHSSQAALAPEVPQQKARPAGLLARAKSVQEEATALRQSGAGLAPDDGSQEEAAGAGAVLKVSFWKALLSGGAGLIGGLVIGGLIFLVLLKSGGSEEKAPAEEAAEPLVKPKAQEPEKPMDFVQLLNTLSQKVADKVGPKFAEGSVARTRLEDRAMGLKDKAKNFVLNELNCTAGALLKAVEAEEAALLLDWNAAVSANFPPPSVLLAGVLSPAILTIRQVGHMLQLYAGLVPIMLLCVWATIADWHTTCVIPTMYAWCYVQGGLAVLLSAGHFMMYTRIAAGKKVLSDKAEAMRARLNNQGGSDEEVGVGEMRELFICYSVLLQQALLVENDIKSSIWPTVTGVGSVLWIITAIWNFVIVAGWTFYPGDIAFHPKAATVAADDYCGALVTVLAARIACLLHIIFFAISLLTVVAYVIDRVLSSSALADALMDVAKSADAQMMGIPVVQTLVKAFVLRGGDDLTGSQLAVTMHSRAQLERELSKMELKMGDLEGRIKTCESQEDALKTQNALNKGQDLEASIAQLEDFGDDDMNDWKERGLQSINALERTLQPAQEASTQELEIIMQKFTDLVEMIQGSDAYKSAMAKAQEAADAAQQQASMVADQLNAENLQSMMAQAQEAAQAGMAQAQQAAEAGMASASEAAGQLSTERLQEAMAQAQESAQKAAEAGMASASEAAGQLSTERLQEAMAQAQESAQKAAEAGMASASSAAAQVQEAGMASASEAAAQAQEAAKQAVEAGKAHASAAAEKLQK